MAESTPVDLAERVAILARSLEIETAFSGAYAMAAHPHGGTSGIDLATAVPIDKLKSLEEAVRADGLSARLIWRWEARCLATIR